MVLAKKINEKKVNIEFNKEFIKIIEEKIKLNDSQFIDNSLKELHPSDSADIIENLSILINKLGPKLASTPIALAKSPPTSLIIVILF